MCVRLRSDGRRIILVLYLELYYFIFRIILVLYLVVGKGRLMFSYLELLSCGEREGVIFSVYYYSDI